MLSMDTSKSTNHPLNGYLRGYGLGYGFHIYVTDQTQISHYPHPWIFIYILPPVDMFFSDLFCYTVKC